jgi:hypothetical protein
MATNIPQTIEQTAGIFSNAEVVDLFGYSAVPEGRLRPDR